MLATALNVASFSKNETKTLKWGIFYRTSDSMYVLRKQHSRIVCISHMRIILAPMYVMKLKLISPHYLYEAEFFENNYNDENLPQRTTDKLRFFRHRMGLTQEEIAKLANVSRATYMRFEQLDREFYPKEAMMSLAKLFEVDVSVLVDEYNLFMYSEPQNAVIGKRKAMGLTQREFAEMYGMPLAAVKCIEQGRRFMFRQTWEKLFVG